MNEKKIWKCAKCNVEIESDDKYCFNCGYITAEGLVSETNKSGYAFKKYNKFRFLLILTCFSIVVFAVLSILRGNNLFKPYFYVKKQITSYIYGYNSSIIKTNNKYDKETINDYNEAIDFIKKDISNQRWQCSSNLEVDLLEYKIEDELKIPSVSFCDMQLEETQKIVNVIEGVYKIFPNIEGGITNITITNASSKQEYIAYFQPLYQFVNSNEDINNFNKVNKTQILLNSYYFLNSEIISNPVENVVGQDYYVKDATWESMIAHELGHYITFKALLNSNNMSNITFVTKDNENMIDEIISEFDSGNFSKIIVERALNEYNNLNLSNISIKEFALSISSYAAVTDDNGNIKTDETIAEAVHDYYLHGDNASFASQKIITVIKEYL